MPLKNAFTINDTYKQDQSKTMLAEAKRRQSTTFSRVRAVRGKTFRNQDQVEGF